ncbi:MAG TPA: hemerythrin domain-containing protein [Alphaproteobacteria bacterium]|nr:hemerythrin domain-containing protein [Alphaproteobacteria bacterium]
MNRVLEQLHLEHGRMRQLLRIIDEQLALYRSGEVPDFDILEQLMEYTLHFPHLVHHPKEDLIFKRLLQRDPASAEEVMDLLTDHAKLGALTHRFAAALGNVARDVELPRDLFEGIAQDYLEEMRRHIELEEREFFPRALLRLESNDWVEIDAAIASLEDPVFGHTLAEKYGKLHQRILDLIE